MLKRLVIHDLAVVSRLDLELDSGFSVLSGETGAGKSILLTALGLALGNKSDPAMVREGAARAEVNLEFTLAEAPEAIEWLTQRELDNPDDADVCSVRRIINAEGRSRAFINGSPVTLQLLQDLSSCLLEIHGQHAHLHLLQAQEQRRLLDENLGLTDLLRQTSMAYKDWQNCIEAFEQTQRTRKDIEARATLITYQLEELRREGIEALDYTTLVQEHTILANTTKTIKDGQLQLDMLSEDELSVVSLLNKILQGMQEILPLAPMLTDALELLQDSRIQIKEAASLLRRTIETMEPDPQRLDWLDQKLGDMHQLARKHQVKPDELAALMQRLETEAAAFTDIENNIETLQTHLQQAYDRYSTCAEALSESRQQGALPLAARITELMQELGMIQGVFQIEVHPNKQDRCAGHGWDNIEFKVSNNPGLAPQSLARIASGGELSRISLAIQVAATDSKRIPTLIYDEVDTGIGGRVAAIVGQKLRALAAQGHQILCVTHLPQVASQAHHHLLVEKNVETGATFSTVRLLDADARLHEVARMLGGVSITSSTLEHAREMLSSCSE